MAWQSSQHSRYISFLGNHSWCGTSEAAKGMPQMESVYFTLGFRKSVVAVAYAKRCFIVVEECTMSRGSSWIFTNRAWCCYWYCCLERLNRLWSTWTSGRIPDTCNKDDHASCNRCSYGPSHYVCYIKYYLEHHAASMLICCISVLSVTPFLLQR